MAPHHDPYPEVVACALLLGWHQILRFPRWSRKYRVLLLHDKEQGPRRIPHVEEGRSCRSSGLLR